MKSAKDELPLRFGKSALLVYLCNNIDDMTDLPLMEKAGKEFTAYLEAHRLRKTPERYAILRKVMQFKSHFDVDELYEAMESESYHVSMATVYNTLRLMENCGLLRSHRFGGGKTQYERAFGNHLHLICSQCGKVREEDSPALMQILADKKFRLFRASFISVYVHGLCASCARSNKKNDNNIPNNG